MGLEAASFKEKKRITKVDEKKLSANSYRINASNIMTVLDKYLTRKKN